MSNLGGPYTPGVPPPPGGQPLPPTSQVSQVSGYNPAGAYGVMGQRPNTGWPMSARLIVAVLAVLVIGAGVLAVVGLTKSTDDGQAKKLQAQLANVQDDLKKAQKDATDLESEKTDIQTQLDDANAKLNNSLTSIAAADIFGAPMPQTSLTAKIDTNKCVGVNTCTPDETVELQLTCKGSHDTCAVAVAGGTPAPLKFDGLSYSGSGTVPDNGSFTCDNVASPTTFTVSLHVTAVSVDNGVLTASGFAGDLVENAAAAKTCTAASLTYHFEQ